MKTEFAIAAGFVLCCCLAATAQEGAKPAATKKPTATAKLKISAESSACLDCHTGTTPVLVQQWQASGHAGQGVDPYP